MARRLRVFIGSSSEVKPAAEQFRQKLGANHDVIPWWEAPEFKNLKSTLQGLIEATACYHAAVFILSPDDLTTSRGKIERSFRDNVLFELGLFLGVLPPTAIYACTIVMPPSEHSNAKKKKPKPDPDLHIPSDLKGIHIPRAETITKAGMNAAIGRMAGDCNEVLQNVLPIERMPGLLVGISHLPEKNCFSLRLRGGALQQYRGRIDDRRLLAVAIRLNNSIPRERNNDIALSELWIPPEFPGGDMRLEVPDKALRGKLRPGDPVDLVLLLSPPGLELQGQCDLNSLFDAGCFFVDNKGIPAKQYPEKK
jgi:Predicted nucleotide-binding protein containing TIR-like domain